MVELRGIADRIGTFILSVPWATRQNAPGAGESATPGHAFLNAGFASTRLAFGFMDVSVRAEARNIFNSEYRNHLSTLRGVVRLEPGRNFVFRLRWGFSGFLVDLLLPRPLPFLHETGGSGVRCPSTLSLPFEEARGDSSCRLRTSGYKEEAPDALDHPRNGISTSLSRGCDHARKRF